MLKNLTVENWILVIILKKFKLLDIKTIITRWQKESCFMQLFR